jgi:hypothetical protein
MSPVQALAEFKKVFTPESCAEVAYRDDVEYAAQLCRDFAAEEAKHQRYDVAAIPLHEAAVSLKKVLACGLFADDWKAQISSALPEAVATAKNVSFRDELDRVDRLQVRQVEEEEEQALMAGDIPQAEQLRHRIVQLQAEAAQRLKECDEAVAALSKLTSQAQQLLARQPAWPRHEILLRFDLTLQRLTTQFVFTKKWFSRFFVLMGSRLYYSDGKNGHPDTAAGTQAYMQSNPAPDGRYCVDLKGACSRCATSTFRCASQTSSDAGCSVAPCSAAVDGQAFAFEIKFPADRPAHKDMCLAATDDVTRQRCVRIIEAASASSLPDIASSAALTRDLLDMKSLSAVKAVLAALGVAIDHPSLKAVGYDLLSLKAAGFSFSAAEAKAAGCDPASAQAAGYDLISLVVAYGYDAVKAAGCDVSCILVSFLLSLVHAHMLILTSPPPPPLQRDGPYIYMSLHSHKVDDRTRVQDGNKPVHVPSGWEIAPGDARDIRVCGAHSWQIGFFAFSNGDMYGTAEASYLAGATLNPSKN